MRKVFQAFRRSRADAAGYRELDAERVLVLTETSGRGIASGLQVELKGAEVFEIHEGKVTRIVVYVDRDRALADLGLEE